MSALPRTDVVLPELLQGEWTTALISTYGADLTFLESRLLSQLAQVPLRTVLADSEQLAATLDEAGRTGQRHRLANKAYVAAPIRHPRAAHAKVILLLGPSDGLLIVGSGNLGYEGYAAPGELWHIFGYSEERTEHLHEFAAARAYLEGILARGLLDPPVGEVLQDAWERATWLPAAPAAATALRSNLQQPILDQMRAAVAEPVEEMIAHAPFHDADCAALGELIDTFAPEQVRLLLTDATSADPAAIVKVLGRGRSIVERVQVKEEPAAYLHAKWVHLRHPRSETLLTGSANLSRSALLRSAVNGNIEVGVISTGRRGDFDYLYTHLRATRVSDVSSLGIRLQGGEDELPVPDAHPVVVWSRIDGPLLTLVFDRALPRPTAIDLQDHAGRTLAAGAAVMDADHVRIELVRESAERVAEGGLLRIRLDRDDDQVSITWPYQLAHLRSRLDKSGQRDHLARVGDLPEQDAELYELLHELDQTLIIDRASVWRIAKPSKLPPPDRDDGETGISLEDLDWERVRRDPRYAGYFTSGRSAALPPTDIQVVLAAIAGRLGEIGVHGPSAAVDHDDDLAHEVDLTSSDASAAEDAEEHLEDELTRRRLPITTRTRMAFDRFARRYAAALDDPAFLEQVGPVPAATNAVVFNHLLIRLLERKAVSPAVGVAAQVKTWEFLWGDARRPGITSALDHEAAEVVRDVLKDAGARATTLRGIKASFDHNLDEETAAALRDTARHVLTDQEFVIDTEQLVGAAGDRAGARRLLDALDAVASPATGDEVLALVVEPYGIPPRLAEWQMQKVTRPGRGLYRCHTFVVTGKVDQLTADRAGEMLRRVAVAAHYSKRDPTYIRIRFEGNGSDMAYWDEDSRSGLALIGEDFHDLDGISPLWPDWSNRLRELAAALEGPAAASA